MRLKTLSPLAVRRSLPLFLAVVACLAIWQVWLTWRLMEQDRNLAAQRSRERLGQFADLAVAQLGGQLGDWDLNLRELNALPPSASLKAKFPVGGTLVILEHQSVAADPSRPLLFVPEAPSGSPMPDVFEAAARFEFREQNYERAIEALQPLTRQPAARAEAFLRIARLERRLHHTDAALAAYDRMLQEATVSPDGVPYALLAAGARCELLADTYDPRHSPAEATDWLRSALIQGRWPLHRATFEYYWAEVNRLRHTADDPPKDALGLSSLVSRLYEQWQLALRTGSSFNGREAQPDTSLLIWHATPSRLTALYAPAGWLGAGLKLPANADDIRWRWLASNSSAGTNPHVLRSLTKPFSPRELRARIRALLRRTETEAGGEVHRFGRFELDLARFELRREGKPLEATHTELKLLTAFIRSRGRVLTREHLLEAVWGSGVFVSDRVVDYHIVALRKKIEDDPAAPRHLVSVRGVGYRFDG